MKLITIILFLTTLCMIQSAKILVLYTFPGKSHYILGSSLARELAERGHDVTMVSAFSEKVLSKNGTYTEVVLTDLFEKLQDKMTNQINMFDRTELNPVVRSTFIAFLASEVVTNAFEHPNFQKFLEIKQKFDVIIIEQFLNDAMKFLSSHFNAPFILVSSVGPNFWVNPLVGNPSPPSYVPDLNLEYSSQMTFCERVVNSLMSLYNHIIYSILVWPQQNKIAQKYIPNSSHLNDVLYNASHPSTNQPLPTIPNMIEIGGFHIKPPKPLPKDLQKFLDDAKDGVIYFSMGSNLKSALLPVEKRDALLKTFSKLKQKVLWKWEEDILPGQHPNVELRKWLPQQDILAHPNVKLFITHGGLLSTTETIYHGVPILAIPVFGDQKLNAKNAVKNGYGLLIYFKDLSEETLTKNINELLNNPKYSINAKTRSKIFHDRLVSPMETAMYWIEYVIRHKGAPHLRVAALDLPWYQYLLLDVIAFVSLLGLVSLMISYLIVKKVCQICKKSKSSKKVKRN